MLNDYEDNKKYLDEYRSWFEVLPDCDKLEILENRMNTEKVEQAYFDAFGEYQDNEERIKQEEVKQNELKQEVKNHEE